MSYAKKSLGQNFLKDKRALGKIIEAAGLHPRDIVLEIGPGRGALTKALLETGAHVVAIEKDLDMFLILQEKFGDHIESGQFVLHRGDILDGSLEAVGLKHHGFSVVANIPYYITGAILQSLLQTGLQPTSLTLLVQKEVAERIVGVSRANMSKAHSTKESILSLSVKAYGTPRYVTTVGAKSFSPAPRVDSAVLQISNISKNLFFQYTVSEEDFFTVIKQGFAQKRKTLMNNFKNAGYHGNTLNALWETLKLEPTVRAEDVPLERWFKITQRLSGAE